MFDFHISPDHGITVNQTCFLFSNSFSLFAILQGSHGHLLPVMFARLYLMKGVQQVLRNGLALLNIRPLQQM